VESGWDGEIEFGEGFEVLRESVSDGLSWFMGVSLCEQTNTIVGVWGIVGGNISSLNSKRRIELEKIVEWDRCGWARRSRSVDITLLIVAEEIFDTVRPCSEISSAASCCPIVNQLNYIAEKRYICNIRASCARWVGILRQVTFSALRSEFRHCFVNLTQNV
jgi:hypothetical protein